MVRVDEHIDAADELLKCLTKKQGQRFALDESLQLPAVVALSMLQVDVSLTETVLAVVVAVSYIVHQIISICLQRSMLLVTLLHR
jgi:hypothetical protein